MHYPDRLLPPDLTVIEAPEMTRHKVVEHFRNSGWQVQGYEQQNVHPDSDGGGENLSMGIINNEGQLVAYGGLIRRDCEWAEMGDLSVNPVYRHRGLAKFLIVKRVQVADKLGIDEITIEDLEPENPLIIFYNQLGFTYDAEQEVFIRQGDQKLSIK